MIEQNPLSSFSIIAGCLSLPAVFAAKYLQSNCGQGNACVLNWLDAHGLVRMAPVDRIPELWAESFWVINDNIAASRLLASGIIWGIAAMVAALLAEYQDEGSPYLGLGFILGALTVALQNPVLGISSMVAGGVALSIVRTQRV